MFPADAFQHTVNKQRQTVATKKSINHTTVLPIVPVDIKNTTASNETLPVDAQNTTENTTASNETLSVDAQNTTENATETNNETLPIDTQNATADNTIVPEEVKNAIEDTTTHPWVTTNPTTETIVILIPQEQTTIPAMDAQVVFIPAVESTTITDEPATLALTDYEDVQPEFSLALPGHDGVPPRETPTLTDHDNTLKKEIMGMVGVLWFFFTKIYNNTRGKKQDPATGTSRGGTSDVRGDTAGASDVRSDPSCTVSSQEGISCVHGNTDDTPPVVLRYNGCTAKQCLADRSPGTQYSSVHPVCINLIMCVAADKTIHDVGKMFHESVAAHNKSTTSQTELHSTYPEKLLTGPSNPMDLWNTFFLCMYLSFHDEESKRLPGVEDEAAQVVSYLLGQSIRNFLFLTDVPFLELEAKLDRYEKQQFRNAVTNGKIKKANRERFVNGLMQKVDQCTHLAVLIAGHGEQDPFALNKDASEFIPIPGKYGSEVITEAELRSLCAGSPYKEVMRILATCHAEGFEHTATVPAAGTRGVAAIVPAAGTRDVAANGTAGAARQPSGPVRASGIPLDPILTAASTNTIIGNEQFTTLIDQAYNRRLQTAIPVPI